MSELGRYPIYYYLMLIYVIKSYILVKSIHGIRVYYTITALERDQYEVLWSRVQQY
jgi:hypothetical protein